MSDGPVIRRDSQAVGKAISALGTVGGAIATPFKKALKDRDKKRAAESAVGQSKAIIKASGKQERKTNKAQAKAEAKYSGKQLRKTLAETENLKKTGPVLSAKVGAQEITFGKPSAPRASKTTTKSKSPSGRTTTTRTTTSSSSATPRAKATTPRAKAATPKAPTMRPKPPITSVKSRRVK
jgi:hypothetical protein